MKIQRNSLIFFDTLPITSLSTKITLPDDLPPDLEDLNAEYDFDYHTTGSARTEGYYKETFEQRMVWKKKLYDEKIEQGLPITVGLDKDGMEKITNSIRAQCELQESRRTEMRRLKQQYTSELTRYNQMNFRKRHVKFMRSLIHGWGLFALEDIPENTMVIEYVGEVIRMPLCDHREEKNEEMGIESSYMFRIDREFVVDATRHGNYARFINHSCAPNCYAKVILSEKENHIAIYANVVINFYFRTC